MSKSTRRKTSVRTPPPGDPDETHIVRSNNESNLNAEMYGDAAAEDRTRAQPQGKARDRQ